MSNPTDTISPVHEVETAPAWLPDGVTPLDFYTELRAVAGRYLSDESDAATFQPTALVHEVFLRMIGVDPARSAGLSREDFFARACRCMRRILIDHARRKQALKRTPTRLDLDRIELHDDDAADVLVIEDALQKLGRIDGRAAQLVRLRFFVGLTIAQAARVLGVSDSTAEQDWRFSRACLVRWLRNGDGVGHTPSPPLPR